jgi:hypothetical protein
VNRKDPLGLFWDGPDIDDLGRLVPGQGPSCVSALQEMASLARQVHSGTIGDKRGHCLAHCKVRKACGKGLGDALSKGLGAIKERYDEGLGIFGKAVKQIGISNPTINNMAKRKWDPDDIAANEQGRTCPSEKSCEEQCSDLWK